MRIITVQQASCAEFLSALGESFEMVFSPSVADACSVATKGDILLLLAPNYPNSALVLDWQLVTSLCRNDVHVFVEFPADVPGFSALSPRRSEPYERCIVTSHEFGPGLAELTILDPHEIAFVPVTVADDCSDPGKDEGHVDIVLSQVAGFRTAEYGITETAWPMLISYPSMNLHVATTSLSRFIGARYAPFRSWSELWQVLLTRMRAHTNTPVRFPSLVHPMHSSPSGLTANDREVAIQRALRWVKNSSLLVDESWYDDAVGYRLAETGPTTAGRVSGDGRFGVLEGFSSIVDNTGRQKVRYKWRNDCTGEMAMSCAVAGHVTGSADAVQVARNLLRFQFMDSGFLDGPRADENSPSFGLMSWSNDPPNNNVYYGDDNARAILGAAAASTVLQTDEWSRRILRCVLSNYRTTGPEGFRYPRIEDAQLQSNGWEHYHRSSFSYLAPHYEAYLWACFLWVYAKTGYTPLLERSKTAIALTMDGYPDRWRWTNGLTQERARMLLPLAWLVRVEDSPLHREWLNRLIQDLKLSVHSSGSLLEKLGEPEQGRYPPPKSNKEYGTAEAPLIHGNSEAVSDLLYSTNFAYLGLHEAVSTGVAPEAGDLLNGLTDFFVANQICSPTIPEFDGAWFRAFDLNEWDYWGSNGDVGWGTWCIESGWTVGWILTILSLQSSGRSVWDLVSDMSFSQYLDEELSILGLR